MKKCNTVRLVSGRDINKAIDVIDPETGEAAYALEIYSWVFDRYIYLEMTQQGGIIGVFEEPTKLPRHKLTPLVQSILDRVYISHIEYYDMIDFLYDYAPDIKMKDFTSLLVTRPIQIETFGSLNNRTITKYILLCLFADFNIKVEKD